MPVLPQNTPPNGGKKPQGKWAQRSKQLSFWVLIILIPVLFLQLQNGKGDQARQIRYDQYVEELRSFLETRGDHPSWASLTDGRRVIAIVEAARESTRRRQEIAL